MSTFTWKENMINWVEEMAEDWKVQVGEQMKKDITARIQKPYPPSGPAGGYPARRTGDLSRSIVTYKGGKTFQIVGATVDYAMHLEMGHRTAAPRPYLRRTVIFRVKNNIRLKKAKR